MGTRRFTRSTSGIGTSVRFVEKGQQSEPAYASNGLRVLWDS